MLALTRRRLPSRSYASRKAFIVQTPSGQVCSLKREEAPWITSRRARPTSGSRLTQSKYCYQKGENHRMKTTQIGRYSQCSADALKLASREPINRPMAKSRASRYSAPRQPRVEIHAPPLPRASVSRRSLPAVEPRDLSRLDSQAKQRYRRHRQKRAICRFSLARDTTSG